MVWRAIKRHRKLLLVTGVAFTVLISLKISLTSDMIASTFQNTGDIDGYFRQLLQADMTWNNSGHVHLKIPGLVEPNVTKKTTQESKPPVKKTDGYNLAIRIRAKCPAPSGRFVLHKPKLGTYQSGKTELCIIWKVGTTFVKRLFMMKTLPKYQDLINPYDISFEQDLPGKRSPIAATTRFMFVRDPYQRLVSAYVDKLVAPNPVYWKIISVNAIRQLRKNNATRLSQQCGHDLTFREFIQYVILTLDPRVLRKPARPDGHFQIQTDICGPCNVKYDFVGKMETFGIDSMELVRKMQISNKTIDLLQQNGSVLASDDAIRDSCHQPFHDGFKKAYIKCISFYEALKRAWLKMQMRGLIGPEEMPLTEAQSMTLTLEQFYQMALKSRDSCPSSERKKLQHEYFLKSYSTITPEELEKIRLIYAQDFKLFEYDDRPSELFHS